MRTHYSSEVSPEMDGEEVIVCGWVHDLRNLGGLIFLKIRDREGEIQVTAPKRKVDPETFELISKLSIEDVVSVRGIVKREDQAPRGLEIIPLEVEVLNEVLGKLPLDPRGRVKAELDTRLDARVVDLRKRENQAIFKLRSIVLRRIREFLYSKGFIEVNTPKIIAAATEGGTALFPVKYFERNAFLSQSPQLYKQMLMGTGLDKVFEIAQFFRAEEHDTRRHVNEFTSIDIEMAFSKKEDVMLILEELLREVLSEVVKTEELKELGIDEKDLDVEFPLPRIHYEEAIEMLSEKGIEVEWGEDIPTKGLKELWKLVGTKAYFIVDWPMSAKPFYIMPKGELSESFDLMFYEIELASGGQRNHLYDSLVKAIRSKGLDPNDFSFYLDAFKWGMPPHSGWGLGLDRLMMALTGADNIREVILFPRDRNRVIP
ncbi:aspartate--tRNA(Asn) ligase [Candidatus Bathyarchaeota archaeon ex4484_205]|nr:MAG: aspartate--tRNA(Asn) ligase [Candidatus Bathyarchaeota archaeon ex4484_205]RLF91066.1 MAG: aspartate--tRNA(Asn) ligase [Thermococci archaeon]